MGTDITENNAGSDGRDVEASLLVRAALLLKECQDNWGGKKHEERLEYALKFNQRLWTFFQAELTDAGNPMPQSVRDDLLKLSAFVDQRTFDALASPDSAKLSVLININRQIAEGLAGSAAA